MMYSNFELDEEIKNFTKLFKNRLDNSFLQDVIHYVDSGERGLAFEILCDHISEYDIPITKEEYNITIDICKKLELDIDDISIKHMFKLIK